MNLQAFREELSKIADLTQPSPTRPAPSKAIVKGPAIPHPGGLKPPPLPTAAQGGSMWDAISAGMKGRGTPNPMVGILKNATPTAGSYIAPKATAAAKLMGANPHNFPKPAKVPSMSNVNPWDMKLMSPSANADTMTAATVPPSRTKVAAMCDEIMKISGFTISPEAREKLPKKDFAVGPKKSNTGKEAYPIPDRRHAGIALGFSKMHGDTADYQAVRAKVKAKYPDMLEAHDKRHEMKKAASAASELAGLGVLAVPSVDELQAHVRARVSGDKSKDAVEKRELLPSAAKPLMEIGGLGTLAAPYLHGAHAA